MDSQVGPEQSVRTVETVTYPQVVNDPIAHRQRHMHFNKHKVGHAGDFTVK